MINKKYSIVSLFSGCGGLDYGFKKENFSILWANDKLKPACESYTYNIGAHILCEDILKVNIDNIPRAEVVIGGPPCQGFSGIGKRDPKDKRSLLVGNYLEVINNIKPKIFLFENVPTILSAKAPNGNKVLDKLIVAFKKLGYSVDVHILNAADYGVPQRRKRLFIIGNNFNATISVPPATHSEKGKDLKKWVSVFDAISDLSTPTQNGVVEFTKKADNDFLKFVRDESKKITLQMISTLSEKERIMIPYVKPGENYTSIPDSLCTSRLLKFKKTGGRTTIFGRLLPNMPAYTLNTFFDKPGIGCNIHYKEDRTITLREGIRLQSFPDNYKFFSTNIRDYYIQVGNAVPVLVGMAWAKHIKKILENTK